MAKLSDLEDKIKCHLRYSEWICLSEYHMHLYYRITQRMIDGKVCNVFDLSNIQIKEKFQNKGYFTAFLIEMEKIADNNKLVIFVENILNDHLYKFLLKRKYSTDYSGICLYRNYNI